MCPSAYAYMSAFLADWVQLNTLHPCDLNPLSFRRCASLLNLNLNLNLQILSLLFSSLLFLRLFRLLFVLLFLASMSY